MQSGTTGINTNCIYSVVKQGHNQDPTGAFVRRWIPELSDIPDQHLQEPWRFDAAHRIIGRVYPERLVDLKISTSAARDTIYGARRSAGFYAAADAIQDKHGSRKSGMAITGQRPKRAGEKRKSLPRKNPAQTEFDL